MNTTIVPPTPGTPVRVDTRAEIARAPFDARDFAAVFRYVDTPAKVERTADGIAFSMARRMILKPGRREIVVELLDGATVTDLIAADQDIAAIRDGRFNAFPWRIWQSETNPAATVYSIMMGCAVTQRGDRIAACSTPGCDENGRHHTVELGEEPTHRQVIAAGNGYRVHLWLDPHASDEPRWETYVDADELDPDTAASLADDLQRALLEAEKLNTSLSRSPALARANA